MKNKKMEQKMVLAFFSRRDCKSEKKLRLLQQRQLWQIGLQGQLGHLRQLWQFGQLWQI